MMELDAETTLGDVYEEIANRLAQARTKALMGERQEALGLMQAASLEYTRFREVLKNYPGHHALEYAFNVTMTELCHEQDALEQTLSGNTNLKPKARRKTVRAA